MFYKAFMRRHNANKDYLRQRQEARDFDAKVWQQHRERLAVRILHRCGGDPDELARAYDRYEWLADIEQALLVRTMLDKDSH